MSPPLKLNPTFPSELEREIFEIAALLYPEFVEVLLLVARRVRTWIEPLRYRVLSVCREERNLRKNPHFCRSLKAIHALNRLKPGVFHDHVRHLAFRDKQKPQDIAPILYTCDATTNLMLFFVGDRDHLPLLARMPLQRLSVLLQLLFPPPAMKDFTHRLFENITHLDIWYYHDDTWKQWSKLAMIPRLSHLSFHDDHISNEICRGALKHCKSLEVLVIICLSQETLRAQSADREELAVDPRFVMLLVSDFMGDWERGAVGGDDYWVRAEKLIRERRLDESSSYVCDRGD